MTSTITIATVRQNRTAALRNGRYQNARNRRGHIRRDAADALPYGFPVGAMAQVDTLHAVVGNWTEERFS